MTSPLAAPTSAAVGTLFELRHIAAGYGPFRALFDVSLEIKDRSVVALLGSNGAGKTTLARVCTGLVKPTAGSIHIDGVDITGQKPYRISRLGIAHAPEGRSVFATLTVAENLLLAFRAEFGRGGSSAALDRAYELFPRLGERSGQLAGTLSGGEQRMLSLARVLVHPPRLLVVDELSFGLAPIIVDEVYSVLSTICEYGTSLLVVEQHVTHALEIADTVVVLSKGSVTYHGPVGELGDLDQYLLPSGSTEN